MPHKSSGPDTRHILSPYERMRRKLWQIEPPPAEMLKTLQNQFGLHPVISRILASRGYDADSTSHLLNCNLSVLINPFLMKDMDKAVRRIHEAIEKRQNILVFGDYDTDGTTSTALLIRTFRFLGYQNISYYIPHRIEEGYGMSRNALDQLIGRDLDLIITVDNGITAVEEVEFAKQRGVDVIITDHHQPSEQLPQAAAVVNPNRPDCPYEFKSLAGVGVTFKLVHALLKEMGVDTNKAKAFLASMLDLVALGTVADIVPLQYENRALVTHGLIRLANTQKAGLMALMEISGCRNRQLNPGVVGYYLTPRINAAGRMDHAWLGVELMITDDPAEAKRLAHRLEDLNNQRRELEAQILDEALTLMAEQCNLEDDRIIVIAGKDWHVGVIGIVASKLLEQYYRPVIILSVMNGVAKGSARSVRGFDIHEVLREHESLLLSYGGHKLAAGLKIETANIDEFRRRINQYAADALTDEDLTPRIKIDAEVSADELTMECVEAISRLEPFGCTNPQPLLVMYGASMKQSPQIVGNNHLKMWFNNGPLNLGAIGFSLGNWIEEYSEACQEVDIVFTPRISMWTGSPRIELEIKALRPSAKINEA